MLGLKNYLEQLFPKICLACEKAYQAHDTSSFLCQACQSEIRLKTHGRCLVCSIDQSDCLLCKQYPVKPKPSWIQFALEQTPEAYKLMRAAYRASGWVSHRSIANILYARFLCSCEPSPTHWIALPDPSGYLGASAYHLDLAKELAKKQSATVMSWNRARFYKAKPTDRLILVAFLTDLESLIERASCSAWSQAYSLGVLAGLMQTDAFHIGSSKSRYS